MRGKGGVSLNERISWNKVLIKLFEDFLKVNNQITTAFANYPHTKDYDCSVNFAPITIFNINDMKDFK